MNIELIFKLLEVAITSSVLACAFIQKTKGMFKTSKWIPLYSFIINIIVGMVFCIAFTNYSVFEGILVGVFSFVDADTLYKTLEGKIGSHADITKKYERIERTDLNDRSR